MKIYFFAYNKDKSTEIVTYRSVLSGEHTNALYYEVRAGFYRDTRACERVCVKELGITKDRVALLDYLVDKAARDAAKRAANEWKYQQKKELK